MIVECHCFICDWESELSFNLFELYARKHQSGLTLVTLLFFYSAKTTVPCDLIATNIQSLFLQIYHNLQALMIMSVWDHEVKLIIRFKPTVDSWNHFSPQTHWPASLISFPSWTDSLRKMVLLCSTSCHRISASLLEQSDPKRSNLLLQRSRLHVRQYQDEVNASHTMSV